MKIYVLTCTIGSGKSTVARILHDLGAAVIDSDKIGREALNPGSAVFQAVVKIFGKEILTSQNTIDRGKLAAKVFENPSALQQLNSIIHPQVDAAVEELFEQYSAQGKKAVFVEMAFIANPRWLSRAQGAWIIKTSRETALKRLAERGLSQAEALARLANQGDPAARLQCPVEIITNDGNLSALKETVEKLFHKIDNE
jgi:dephospho-CoA kinase